jgi:2,4-dienoyl-CoA reductase-like NADH-dependent reductase (Old Yellow Enzyme family)
MSEYLDRAFSPARLGTLALKNRVIKAATYEGKSPDGIPGDNLKQFHKEIVEGGVAMTTIGYCTTEHDGRINDQMMWLHEGVRPQLTDMITELKEIDPQVKVSGQVTQFPTHRITRRADHLHDWMSP